MAEMAFVREVVSMSDTSRRFRPTRSTTVTVRIEPKVRYGADLAARKQRRTVSSFIEAAIERALEDVEAGFGTSFRKALDRELWDVDEADRFAKLALHYPELLTHEEEILWKLIRENGALWRGRYTAPDREWVWDVQEKSLLFRHLRQHWDTFKQVASGEKDESALPTWNEYDPADIPF